jgi:hypothetical protein
MLDAGTIGMAEVFLNIDMRRNALRLLTPYDNLRYTLRGTIRASIKCSSETIHSDTFIPTMKVQPNDDI